jgi:hypothetical protein
MRIRRSAIPLILAALLTAAPVAGAAGEGSAIGGGYFLFAGTVPMQFGFGATVHPDGSVDGSFHHFYVNDGFTYDFWGTLTCLTFDPVNHRAWIGGYLTKMTSTDPAPGVSVGDDAWFRVLDSPDGDRSTAMGFPNELFQTSQQYCDEQPWPEPNLRTHPVTSGQIKVDAP